MEKIVILVSVFAVYLESHILKPVNSKYLLKKLDIQVDIQIHDRCAKSKTDKNVVTQKSIGRPFSSVNQELNRNIGIKNLIPECVCNRIGECLPKGCNRPKARSRSLQAAGLKNFEQYALHS